MIGLSFTRNAACAALLLISSAVHAQVYRCGNTYSQEACKGGRAVDTSAPVSVEGGPSGGGTKTIYLCQSHGGGMFWSSAHCHKHNAFIERTESVPANMGWDDQVRHAQHQRNQAQALTPSAPQPAAAQRQPMPNRTAECSALDERVKMLDSMGRAGSRYYDLDWVRRERKEARDHQFRLRC
ncbi:hypothetical protein B2J88_48830 [Rhodococcus sp. SRB_17]|uniref:DUF4124 domain-containing protein n=1 Tax=Acidovorax sp. SRB_24 TaxID=1962700 RepID=UPI00145F8818|nr:DUF4124 domain-containing protein [Acidovorax sp. SRB_24]NMM78845.1 hypothetical protein [Acidovorax sp. SRB_24]NMM92079.1 hypothetical protein [Rhodococcus sp. SRB_17]